MPHAMHEPTLHTRESIRLLHHAHADHIESIYRGLARRPGDPDGVVIRQFDQTRTFLANGRRLENRAILTGNESHGQMDQVFAHFRAHGANCVIEINPANFYRTQPFSWESQVVPLLLERGCRIEDMRCVWARDLRPGESIAEAPCPVTETFGSDRLEVFCDLASVVEPERKQEMIDTLAYAQGGNDWVHVIGYEGDRPVSRGELFVTGSTGYLAWWYTHPSHRHRGHQQAGIRRRVSEAAKRGCRRVFTVTDFDIPSSRNLQACGFRIAYNYLMLILPGES